MGNILFDRLRWLFFFTKQNLKNSIYDYLNYFYFSLQREYKKQFLRRAIKRPDQKKFKAA